MEKISNEFSCGHEQLYLRSLQTLETSIVRNGRGRKGVAAVNKAWKLGNQPPSLIKMKVSRARINLTNNLVISRSEN